MRNDFLPGMDYGTGYDTLTGEIRGDAVIRTEPTNPVGLDGQQTLFKLEVVEDTHSLARSMEVNASASLRLGFGSGSAKAAFVSQQEVNSYSVFCVVSVSVRNATKAMRDVTLNSSALKLVSSPMQFRKKYGDRFVSAISSGGEFYAILRISTQTQEEKANVAASIRAKGLTWNASAGFKQTLESINTSYDMSAWVMQTGGSELAVPVDQKSMMDRALNFPLQVKGSAFPYSVELMDYQAVAPAGYNPIRMQEQMNHLNVMSGYLYNYQDRLADIDYILMHPDEFSQFDRSALMKERDKFGTAADEIYAAAGICFDDYNHCSIPLGHPKTLELGLPVRKKNIVQLRRTVESVKSSWQDTGLHLEAEQTVEIQYESGVWRIGSPETSYPMVDAEGYKDSPTIKRDPNWPLIYDVAPIGSLIGRVGNSESQTFYVGKNKEYTPASSGNLFLMMNDSPTHPVGFTDNVGNIQVRITTRTKSGTEAVTVL